MAHAIVTCANDTVHSIHTRSAENTKNQNRNTKLLHVDVPSSYDRVGGLALVLKRCGKSLTCIAALDALAPHSAWYANGLEACNGVAVRDGDGGGGIQRALQ